jgi:hypothetical protein
VSGAGKTTRVRRLLDFVLKEYSFAAQQAIAHPEALVAGVKTAPAAVAPTPAPFSKRTQQKTHDTAPEPEPDGEAARAARREQARTELERCDLEARTEQAAADLRRARLAELRAQNEELGRFVLEQQRRAVDEQIREREERERRHKERVQQLHDLAAMPIPRTMQDCEESLADLDRFLDREAQAEQDRLWRETDAALSRRTWDWTFRRSWDRRHPGGVDACSCDGCRAYRREPPR